MQKHNPIFYREAVLQSLTKTGRQRIQFIPIALLDLPFDEYRELPKKNPDPGQDRG